MAIDAREAAFRAALKPMEGDRPRSLATRAAMEAEDRGITLGADDLSEVLEAAPSDSAFLSALGMQVHKWDAAPISSDWTEGTAPSTEARRSRICALLGMDARAAEALLTKRPIFRDETIIISAPWNKWYDNEVADRHAFYWPRYRDYLLNVRKWEEENVTSLDLATTQVVERLTDPTRSEVYQSKGLVVGYVQSGKTANFTGVIAKAIDAGYRLIIVMTGTIELLRSQTQRRIDMELVGRQNIIGDIPPELAVQQDVDYADDPDWIAGRFLDLGDSPITEIVRLTRHQTDYKGLGSQFKSLKMERAVASSALYTPENLFTAKTRVAIVKKNAPRLRQLVKDIQANSSAFAEIPVLIIDDESDEASVNTVDPEKVRQAKEDGTEIKERRAINECIADLLRFMPRAQYVGYTATPFANVFVDPSDPLTIFPRDFVISLRRPPGYMGVEDFHDLALDPSLAKDFNTSNESAFVRSLEADEDDTETQLSELREAVDAFVLSGAVKLYRESVDPSRRHRHHTMLAHSSVTKDSHKELARMIREEIWDRSEFSTPTGKARLRALYDRDTRPVSVARVEEGVAAAPPFDVLVPFIPKAIAKISEVDANPVLVVNSDKEIEQQVLDFDRNDTWRILVGGAKLSRGFTVEGLTITYFRRATNMSASLTQMGRWFGFRQGYRDLVRLYIARNARFGKRVVDLYEAFAAVALDESAFRDQLAMYAEWDGDRPRVRPIEIPPLVTQHLPWLKPTARNKMFNAVLEEQSQEEFKPTGYPLGFDALEHNLDLWRPLLAQAQGSLILSGGTPVSTYNAYAGVVPADAVIEAIDGCEYLERYKETTIDPSLSFLRRIAIEGHLSDFLLVMPQPGGAVADVASVGTRSVVSRDRRENRGGLFGEITDPKHRPAIRAFLGDSPADHGLKHLQAPDRGVVLVYLARESHPESANVSKSTLPVDAAERGLVVGWSVLPPTAAVLAHRGAIRFRVRNPKKKDDPTVEVPGGSDLG